MSKKLVFIKTKAEIFCPFCKENNWWDYDHIQIKQGKYSGDYTLLTKIECQCGYCAMFRDDCLECLN